MDQRLVNLYRYEDTDVYSIALAILGWSSLFHAFLMAIVFGVPGVLAINE